MSRKLSLYLCGIVALMLVSISAHAAPPPPTEASPIDGGAIFMLAGLLGYGYQKLRAKNDGE